MLRVATRLPKIAITGGIAEGKSTVAEYLAELGLQTASSDQFARECFVDPDTQAKIAALLGVSAPVPPSALRAAIAQYPNVRRAVNRIMHPGVVRRIVESPATVVEVPLLIETCLHTMFEQVWVVTCGAEEQLRRLQQRDGEDAARDLIDSQLKSFAKTAFADVIVRTNEPRETVKRFVQHAAQIAFPIWIARFER